ncbi:MAG: hypothetical protein AAF560_22170 [Acidobacteriota bacterium]
MADNTPVSLTNNTDETLYLCVQVNGVFQEWSLPRGGSQTINAETTQVVMINSQQGACPQ